MQVKLHFISWLIGAKKTISILLMHNNLLNILSVWVQKEWKEVSFYPDWMLRLDLILYKGNGVFRLKEIRNLQLKNSVLSLFNGCTSNNILAQLISSTLDIEKSACFYP
jgi:hypothetical protein